jgi:hypothetical protein
MAIWFFSTIELSFCLINLYYPSNYCDMAVNKNTKRFITVTHGSRLKYKSNLLWNFLILEAINYRVIFIKFATEFTINLSYTIKLD